MATCKEIEECVNATSECEKLSHPFMNAKKNCLIKHQTGPAKLSDTNDGLLPCPFCGNEHVTIETHKQGRLFAFCQSAWCGASSGFCDSESEVNKIWNTRQ